MIEVVLQKLTRTFSDPFVEIESSDQTQSTDGDLVTMTPSPRDDFPLTQLDLSAPTLLRWVWCTVNKRPHPHPHHTTLFLHPRPSPSVSCVFVL